MVCNARNVQAERERAISICLFPISNGIGVFFVTVVVVVADPLTSASFPFFPPVHHRSLPVCWAYHLKALLQTIDKFTCAAKHRQETMFRLVLAGRAVRFQIYAYTVNRALAYIHPLDYTPQACGSFVLSPRHGRESLCIMTFPCPRHHHPGTPLGECARVSPASFGRHLARAIFSGQLRRSVQDVQQS